MNCLRPERPDHPSSRGLLLPLFVALGILLLTAASVDLFPKWLAKGKVEVRTVSGLSTRPQLDPRYSGLIDPHNGDNGTDPAQTTTAECTGDFSLPVLAGVDVVAYFSLNEGEPPVYGTENYMALFGAYRFYFGSMGNLRTFENEPLKYIPAWGGFCSYGISSETVWTDATLGPFGDPTKWKILPDGRLHVFRSSVPQAKFADDVLGNIDRGNDVWLNWFGEKGGPLNTACICAELICDDQ